MVSCLRSIQELREHLDRIDSPACWSWNTGTGLAQMLSDGGIIQIFSRDLRSKLSWYLRFFEITNGLVTGRKHGISLFRIARIAGTRN